jgi:rhodanese-related sulfurtransferase
MKRTIIITLILISTVAAVYTFTGRQLLSPSQAKQKIAKGEINTVIDVRTKVEFDAGHYPGAAHIPVQDISLKTTTGLPPRGLLVYCNTGQRARYAAQKLSSLGFRDVYYIACGYTCLTP